MMFIFEFLGYTITKQTVKREKGQSACQKSLIYHLLTHLVLWTTKALTGDPMRSGAQCTTAVLRSQAKEKKGWGTEGNCDEDSAVLESPNFNLWQLPQFLFCWCHKFFLPTSLKLSGSMSFSCLTAVLGQFPSSLSKSVGLWLSGTMTAFMGWQFGWPSMGTSATV